jgi:hypothetical protein
MSSNERARDTINYWLSIGLIVLGALITLGSFVHYLWK